MRAEDNTAMHAPSSGGLGPIQKGVLGVLRQLAPPPPHAQVCATVLVLCVIGPWLCCLSSCSANLYFTVPVGSSQILC